MGNRLGGLSKAFLRESDNEPDPPDLLRQAAILPPGAKNNITAGGAQRLRGELEQLVAVDRPRVAALADEVERRREQQALNRRISRLQEILRTADVVAPGGPADRVGFGATVTVRHADGSESDYRLVGTEETDHERGWVSWQSPIAKALLNAHLGSRVAFNSPSGRIELEIVGLRYE